jgi:nitroimidazol reductase NimA-like FMN-containing flavoprotein (pyridoxamine 5'-phosphate oxidase superfamily)
MRRRGLTQREATFLARERVVRLATAGRDGLPWVVPVCHAVAGGRIYIGSDRDGRKVRHMARTRRAALVADRYVDSWRGLRGVALTGRAEVFARGPVFARGVRLLYRKYRHYQRVAALEAGDSVIVRVTPTHVMSWQYGT